MLQSQTIAGNPSTNEPLDSQEQNQGQGQGQNQIHSGKGQSQGQLFSPTMTDSSMAILSPPSSRYAFDPTASGNSNNNLPMDSVLSPLPASVASPVSELNFANLSISAMSPPVGYGVENDVPAFQPQTELLLENFTNDLKVFNNWVHGLNVEEQKTAIGLFLDSIKNQEVIDFIQNKISTVIPSDDSKGNITFSPPLSANTSLPQRLRPVSPIIPISNMNHRENPVPITLDSILNSDSNGNGSSNTNNGTDGIGIGIGLGMGIEQDDSVVYKPAPRRMLSPPIMKTGFSKIIEPIERPKSADPSYPSNTAFVDQMGGSAGINGGAGGVNGYSQFGMNSPMSPLLGNQPLFRVLSDGYQDTPENVSFNYYYNNNNSHNGGTVNGSDCALGTKLQQSLNTINNRSMIDSSRAVKEDRGRHKNSQNKPSNLNLNLNMNPKMGMNNLNYGMNMSMLSNGNGNGNGSGGSGGSAAAALQNLTQSMSVPPHNRIRSINNRGAGTSTTNSNTCSTSAANLNSSTKPYHASKLQTHGYSKSGSSLGSMLHGSYGSSTSLLTEDERRALQLKKKLNTNGNGNGNSNSTPNVSAVTATSATNSGSNIPKDIASDALLADIPAWLKTLRLHKYTENLQHLKWEDMVQLDDAELANLGVSTLGARNKLLKSFAYVKERRGIA